MSFDKILNKSTVLKYIEIKIDDYTVLSDDIVSLEFKQDFFDFGLIGSLKMKDSFDINNNGIVNFGSNNKIKISMVDFSGYRSSRTYRLVNTKTAPENGRFKVLDFHFIDEISFILRNTYISKSFTAKPIEALKEYLTYLGIDDILKSDTLTYNFDDISTSRNFVVPQNVSVLEFFINYFKQDNIRFWQDRNGLYIKSITPKDMVPMLAPDSTEYVKYSNKVTNNDYLFKIHDYSEVRNPVIASNNTLPISKTFRYNFVKEITDVTTNLIDISDDMSLNLNESSNVSNLQQTIGEKYTTQSIDGVDVQSFDLFNTYMSSNQLLVAVPGSLKYSNIGNVADVTLKGNVVYSKSDMQGDELLSGRYFITNVSDRIIGDKLITRLGLNRVDSKKPGAIR